MLQPKRTKFRKMHKGRNKGLCYGDKIFFGEYAIKAISRGFLNGKHIEAARRVISRTMKRQGKIWIRIFPDKPITKKPLEVRMGKGKGNVEDWVINIKPGKILYEINGVDINIAKQALKLANAKLPLKTIFISKIYEYQKKDND